MDKSINTQDTTSQNEEQEPAERLGSPVSEKIGKQDQPSDTNEGCGNQNGGRSNWIAGLWGQGPDRQLELIFACVIALSSIVQIIITVTNNSSTSAQVDKIIGAADGIKDSANQMKNAAWDFKGSAQGIDGNFGNAVAQLQSQVMKMDAARTASEQQSRQALQATVDNFHLDQRAWVEVDTWQLYKFEPGQPLGLSVMFMNRGRTPAIDVKIGATSGRIISNDHSPEQIKDLIQEEISKASSISKTLAPITPSNGERLDIKSTSEYPVVDQSRFDAVSKGISNWYTVGKITYKDVFKHPQWMTFCLQISYEQACS